LDALRDVIGRPARETDDFVAPAGAE